MTNLPCPSPDASPSTAAEILKIAQAGKSDETPGNGASALAELEASADSAPVSDFPVPSAWREFEPALREMASALNVPLGMVCTAALGMLSVTLGAAVRVVGAIRHRAQETPTNIYVLITAPSGSGKSELMRLLLWPLRKFEGELEPVKVTRKHLKNGKAEELEVAVEFILEDVTPEALVEAFGPEDCRLPYLALVSSDARKVLSIFGGRYANGRGDFDPLLKGFSGDFLRQRRVTRGYRSVQDPCVGIVWMLQDDLRADLADQESAQSGFLGRSLIATFLDAVRELPLAPAEKMEHLPLWNRRCESNLQTFQFPKAERRYFIDGSAGFAEFAKFHNKLLHRKGLPRGVAERGAEQAIRIAGSLHATEHGSRCHEIPLSEQTASEAIAIVQWFFQFVDEAADLRDAGSANKILRFLGRRENGATFNQIRQFTKISKNELRRNLGELIEAGLIHCKEVKAKNGRTICLYAPAPRGWA